MKPIRPPDLHHLNAALGWLELGDTESASEELICVSPELTLHPTVLDLQWQIHAARKGWKRASEIGQQLVDTSPEIESGWIHHSFALHELQRTTEAKALLEQALKKFPGNGLIRYNLACYACQLDDAKEAMFWLGEAMSIEGKKKILKMAQNDPDLAPLRDEIQRKF